MTPVHAVGLDHTLGGIVTEIHPVEVFPHRSFNGLLALEIGVVGSPVLLQLSMLFRIGSGVGVNGGFIRSSAWALQASSARFSMLSRITSM